MTFRTALRLVVLGCIALFSTAMYLHSQPALVASVVLGVAAAIVYLATGTSGKLRDKLCARALPHLEPGETLQAVFSAVSGPGPYLTLLLSIIAMAFIDRPDAVGWIMNILGLFETQWTVVATDRAILLLKSSARQEELVVTRLPRDTRLGPVSGWWATIWLNGEEMFVPRSFHADVELADNAIAPGPDRRAVEPAADWRRRHKRVSLRFRGGHSRGR